MPANKHMQHPGRFAAFIGAALAILLLAGTSVTADDEVSKPNLAAKAYEDALKRAEGIESSLVKAVEKVRLNSVTVMNLRRRKMKGQEEPVLVRASGGSGVIISRKSKLWILTNVHVIAGHHGLQVVTHDGVIRDVVLHDSIDEYDIALLRFKEKPRRVKFRGVSLYAKYMKGLKEGTWVIATGNPFFLAEDGASVTTLGVISGMDRFLGGRYQYVGAIQHDAEVNPGNSGGPLWNLSGKLIGINGKIATPPRIAGVRPTNSGAAFALPVNQVEAYLKKLVGEENAEAGFLGIEAETATDDKGKAIGARVKRVHPRSPMMGHKDRAKKDDVITSITIKGSTKRVYTNSDLKEILSVLSAGAEITVKYKRSRKTKRWKGRLGDRGR